MVVVVLERRRESRLGLSWRVWLGSADAQLKAGGDGQKKQALVVMAVQLVVGWGIQASNWKDVGVGGERQV